MFCLPGPNIIGTTKLLPQLVHLQTLEHLMTSGLFDPSGLKLLANLTYGNLLPLTVGQCLASTSSNQGVGLSETLNPEVLPVPVSRGMNVTWKVSLSTLRSAI